MIWNFDGSNDEFENDPPVKSSTLPPLATPVPATFIVRDVPLAIANEELPDMVKVFTLTFAAVLVPPAIVSVPPVVDTFPRSSVSPLVVIVQLPALPLT